MFLIGLVLCGLAEDITELLVLRAAQSLGTGGLIVRAQTVTGNLVSPRRA